VAQIESPSLTETTTAVAARFRAVRARTAALVAPLSAEDQMVQSCAEASPVKWHLAHSTWFFETFILRQFVPGYHAFDEDFFWLFNSYYKSLGGHPEKRLRASFSRPSLEQVLAYRRHVEDGILRLLEESAAVEVLDRIELGMHHEQQHQELIATDIKHAFWSNPLQPAYQEWPALRRLSPGVAQNWLSYSGGLTDVGNDGNGFAFDNELSRHRVYLAPFQLASSPVTCAEYLEFMRDDGYRRPELWLSDGWDAIEAQAWNSPLYWKKDADGAWNIFTLHGLVPLEDFMTAPVCHISYYEAEAYARWAGSRLPTEFEWEHAAADLPVIGNFLESDTLHPQGLSSPEQNGMERLANSGRPRQMFGDVWEWTQSAYTAYPGYKPAGGALGEYNGKFMSGQMILRGGSAATPASHIRATYRNFFSPATRWQFSGIRLAKDGTRS
jgi:ergothioneine biosynthesis protein EgtB